MVMTGVLAGAGVIAVIAMLLTVVVTGHHRGDQDKQHSPIIRIGRRTSTATIIDAARPDRYLAD